MTRKKLFLQLLFVLLFCFTNINAAIRVVVLGSSTAYGYKLPDPTTSWVNRYKAYLQSLNPSNEVINLAVGGYTTYEIMPSDYTPAAGRPSPDVTHNITKALKYNPQAIIINMPTNDVANGYTISEQINNYNKIIAVAQKANIPVWITTSQPRNLAYSYRLKLMEVRDSINSIYKDHALDFWTTIALDNGQVNPIYDLGDGTHVDAVAHQILYERVVKADIPNYIERSSSDPKYSTAIDNESISSIAVYPNPFIDLIYFPESTKIKELLVFDMQGRIVAKFTDIENEVNLSSLNNGIYIIRIKDESNTISTKRMIKKG